MPLFTSFMLRYAPAQIFVCLLYAYFISMGNLLLSMLAIFYDEKLFFGGKKTLVEILRSTCRCVWSITVGRRLLQCSRDINLINLRDNGFEPQIDDNIFMGASWKIFCETTTSKQLSDSQMFLPRINFQMDTHALQFAVTGREHLYLLIALPLLRFCESRIQIFLIAGAHKSILASNEL